MTPNLHYTLVLDKNARPEIRRYFKKATVVAFLKRKSINKKGF